LGPVALAAQLTMVTTVLVGGDTVFGNGGAGGNGF
jgi:hypothetical protein